MRRLRVTYDVSHDRNCLLSSPVTVTETDDDGRDAHMGSALPDIPPPDIGMSDVVVVNVVVA